MIFHNMNSALLNYFLENKNRLFWMDAIGAFVSVSIIALIWARHATWVGMPENHLHLLAAVPIVFIVYDLAAIYSSKGSKSKWLLGIVLLNVSYCILSLFFLFINLNNLTTLGWMYFVPEIVIVAYIAYLEYNVMRLSS